MRKVGFLIVLAGLSSACIADNFKYYEKISLEGTLTTGVAEASVTADEMPHQFPALKLDRPINVTCDQEEQDCQPEKNISLLHLVLKQDQIEIFKKRKSNKTAITGELFHSDNANHFTSVLLDVKSIE